MWMGHHCCCKAEAELTALLSAFTPLSSLGADLGQEGDNLESSQRNMKNSFLKACLL